MINSMIYMLHPAFPHHNRHIKIFV